MLLHITEKCNYNCPHCFTESTPEGKDVDLKVIESTLDFVEKTVTKVLVVSGGEPSEHDDFGPILYYILKRLEGKCIVILATNGSFLINQSKSYRAFIKLNMQFMFFTQITAVKGLYPFVSQTKSEYKKLIKEHPGLNVNVGLIKKMTVIEYLGRAKGREFKNLGKLYKRKGPMCFNLYSVAKLPSITSLKELMQFIDANITSNCKPFVDIRGDIHPGEWTGCNVLGNVLHYNDDEIFHNLVTGFPCGKCSIAAPENFFDLK